MIIIQKHGSLWQYCKEIPVVNDAGDVADFNGANATDSFNFKTKITGQTDDGWRNKKCSNNVSTKILKHFLENFWDVRNLL